MQEPQASWFETAGRNRAAPTPQSIPQFGLLETSRDERKRRWASFAVGSTVDILGLVVFLWALTVVRSVFKGPQLNERLWSARITLPAPLAASPPSRPSVAPAPHPAPPLKRSVQPPAPRPKLVVPLPALPPAARPQPKPVPQPPKVAALPPHPELPKQTIKKLEPQTHVGEFDSASSALTKLRLPPSKVQTGGFGSPDGLPGQAEGGSHGNVPHLGSFDLPEGPGSGNGTGGEHGARGPVASAGFGNGIASAGTGRGNETAGNGPVRPAGFADAQAQAGASPSPKPQAASVPYDPVQITEKPHPVYTAEARELRIQGEVLLRVVFTVSGRVLVLGIERGLGHGLDEAATRAAEQIQFKPARRNGQAVDTAAVLHILFQLAN